MSRDAYDIAVVGAGAAGLAAAIFAAEAGRGRLGIIALDGAARLGAKILVSGGGRCNVTHDAIRDRDYHGHRPTIRKVLRGFDQPATVRWFESIGVELKRESTGKLFPVTDSARTVLDALLGRAERLGVELAAGHRVTEVRRPAGAEGEPFTITTELRSIGAKRVVLAAGGRSLPKSGSDGSGWSIVRKLGHTVTPTAPALAPLALNGSFFHAALSGIAHEAQLSSYVEGRRVDQRTGSLLWTHFGISGPVVMDVSRFFTLAKRAGRPVELRASLLPGERFEAVERWLIDAAGGGGRTLGGELSRRLPRRVAEVLAEHVECDPAMAMDQLPRTARRRLVGALTELTLPVERDRGWNYAEVTAGGVPLSEIEPATLASRIVPGLHIIGEMLDCDGRIGGFNFQWAWSTGHLAGRAAANAALAVASK